MEECKCELDGFQGAIWTGDCPLHNDAITHTETPPEYNQGLGYRKALLEGIKKIDFKQEHICRFNDGEQNCDCLHDVLSIIEKHL